MITIKLLSDTTVNISRLLVTRRRNDGILKQSIEFLIYPFYLEK